MKEVKIMVEKIIGYEAMDGTRFDSEEECNKYEKCCINVVRNNFLKLVGENGVNGDAFYDVCDTNCECTFYGLTVNNLDEIEVVNRAVEMNEYTSRDRLLDASHIGKQLIIARTYDGDVWFLGEVDSLVKSYERILKSLFEK